ncbi:MAG TPA: type II and III secretion system protein [Terracidiphilus sp.]|nr:type II and III secretion system protein [Terracidiphilus sp.]
MKTSKYVTALSTAVGFLLTLAAVPRLFASDFAKSLYKQGQSAELRQDYDAAYNDYRKAALDDPGSLKYKSATERTRPLAAGLHIKRGRELKENGNITGALTEFLRAAAVDPSDEAAEQAIASLKDHITPGSQKSDLPQLPVEHRRLASLAGPIDLKPISDESITLHMAEDSKVVYESIGKAAGINVLFDPEYNSKRISIELTNTSLEDALRVVATSSETFWKPVTKNTIFVASDTRVKRQQLEQQAIRVLYLANATQQNDLNDVQTALRNVLPNAKLYGVQSQDAIVMRGTPDELMLAEQLIDDLDKARPEVMIDVTVMQVDKDKVRNIGLQWPQSLSATLKTTSTDSNATLTLNDLANLNAKNFSLTVGTAQAEMLLTDTDTQIMQNPRLRAADGQKATMKIGERIPIATGSFSSTAGSSAASPYVNTQFQYIDIGVVMEMTPTIHYDGDVTLKVRVEITSHNSDTTISGVTEPIIGQQSVEEMIRLKEGESNILGGLLQEQNNHSVSGTPGLGEVPILKYLFSTQQRELQHEEIVFLLTPHLVRGMQIDPLNLRQIDTGTSNAIELREVPSTPEEKSDPPR